MREDDVDRELAGVVGDDPSPDFVAELRNRVDEELAVGDDSFGDGEDQGLHVVGPDDPGRGSSGRWWIRGGLAAAAAAILVIAVVSTDRGGDGDTVVASGDPDPTVAPTTTIGDTEAQVTLTWVGPGDLGLLVFEREGEVIGQGTQPGRVRESASGGVAGDNDYGRCGDSADETHTEQVTWPAGTTPSGEIRAFVQANNTCGGPIDYVLEASVQDQIVLTDSGSVVARRPSPQIAFTVP